MSSEMYAYRVKDHSVVSPVYLQLLLRSRPAREMLEGMTTGTSNRTRLENAGQLLELPIPPLPALADQRQVAELFERSIASYRLALETQREAESAVGATWWAEGRPPQLVNRGTSVSRSM
jgi:hypothetical protein